MKRFLASLFLSLIVCLSYALGQTPTLIQSYTSACNPNGLIGAGEAGNNWKFTLPNQTLANNTLVLQFTIPQGTTITSLTDNQSNTYTQNLHLTNSTTGNQDEYIYTAPVSTAGVTTFTLVTGATTNGFCFRWMEWNNIAASPANGTSSSAQNITSSGSALTCGSFTPGNNNGNGGNLILAFYDLSTGFAGGNPTSWAHGTSGGTFTLHDADIAWNNNQGYPKASEYFVQTTSAAISPAITINGDATDTFNCIAIALKVASAGTPQGSGIKIVKYQAFGSTAVSGTTWPLQTPLSGNLGVLIMDSSNQSTAVTSVTDNHSHTWTKEQLTVSVPQCYFLANATPNDDELPTFNFSVSPGGIMEYVAFYDIINASTSQPGATASTGATSVPTSQTFINDQPDITPQKSNSVVTAILSNGLGPTTAVTSPTGALNMSANYTNHTDGSIMDSGDGHGHLYTTSTAAEAWDWTIAPQTGNQVTSIAIEWLAAPTGACGQLALMGVGC